METIMETYQPYTEGDLRHARQVWYCRHFDRFVLHDSQLGLTWFVAVDETGWITCMPWPMCARSMRAQGMIKVGDL